MKIWVALIIGLCSMLWLGNGVLAATEDKVHNDTGVKQQKSQGSQELVHVDELAAHPDDFRKGLLVRGVVAGVKKAEGIFAIIDSREYESCGILTCAPNTLPVRFSGELPSPTNMVEVSGRVVDEGQGLIIDATNVEVLK